LELNFDEDCISGRSFLLATILNRKDAKTKKGKDSIVGAWGKLLVQGEGGEDAAPDQSQLALGHGNMSRTWHKGDYVSEICQVEVEELALDLGSLADNIVCTFSWIATRWRGRRESALRVRTAEM
jgi:hypothetical protein